MAYRATRTEGRVAVGVWTKDLSQGQVLADDEVPDDVAEHLKNHGLLVDVDDGSGDNPWFGSDDPDLASIGKPKSKK